MRARRLAYCRTCSTETPQTYLGSDRPHVETWRCRCGVVLISLGDIDDADGFARSIADSWLRKQAIPTAGFVEREEVHAEARAALWSAFLRWDPSRGIPFRSYAAWKTGALLTDWIRQQRGRTYGDDRSGLKPHADAVSLDAAPPPEDGDDPGSGGLDVVIGTGAGDPARDRSPDLARALKRGGRSEPRTQRGMDLATACGAT